MFLLYILIFLQNKIINGYFSLTQEEGIKATKM